MDESSSEFCFVRSQRGASLAKFLIFPGLRRVEKRSRRGHVLLF